jgi:hypothetical protein
MGALGSHDICQRLQLSPERFCLRETASARQVGAQRRWSFRRGITIPASILNPEPVFLLCLRAAIFRLVPLFSSRRF